MLVKMWTNIHSSNERLLEKSLIVYIKCLNIFHTLSSMKSGIGIYPKEITVAEC